MESVGTKNKKIFRLRYSKPYTSPKKEISFDDLCKIKTFYQIGL